MATGPLTNIAKALQLEPALGELIGTLTIMGGAALAPGNRTPVAGGEYCLRSGGGGHGV